MVANVMSGRSWTSRSASHLGPSLSAGLAHSSPSPPTATFTWRGSASTQNPSGTPSGSSVEGLELHVQICGCSDHLHLDLILVREILYLPLGGFPGGLDSDIIPRVSSECSTSSFSAFRTADCQVLLPPPREAQRRLCVVPWHGSTHSVHLSPRTLLPSYCWTLPLEVTSFTPSRGCCAEQVGSGSSTVCTPSPPSETSRSGTRTFPCWCPPTSS